jgi:hypothetical protein
LGALAKGTPEDGRRIATAEPPVSVRGVILHIFLPRWNGRFWDGQPVVVKIEDLDEFKSKNGVRVQMSTWPEGCPNPVVEVTAAERKQTGE